MFKDFDVAIPCPWKPVVDGYSSKPFLPQRFEDAIRDGNFDKDVVILAGTNSREGLIFSSLFMRYPGRWSLVFNDWEKWSPQFFFGRQSDVVSEADRIAVRKIRQKYYPNHMNSTPSLTAESLMPMEEITSMTIFKAPLQKDVDILVSHGVKVYMYNFDYAGTMSIADVFRLSLPKLMLNMTGRNMGFKLYRKELGVCHGDDLFYMFPMAFPGLPKSLKTQKDTEVSKLFVKALMTFAIDPSINDQWTPYNNEQKVFHFKQDGTTEMVDHNHERDFCTFFNQISTDIEQPLSEEPITKIFSVTAEKR